MQGRNTGKKINYPPPSKNCLLLQMWYFFVKDNFYPCTCNINVMTASYYLHIPASHLTHSEKTTHLDSEPFRSGSSTFTLESSLSSRGGESDLERDFLRVSGERRFTGDLLLFLLLQKNSIQCENIGKYVLHKILQRLVHVNNRNEWFKQSRFSVNV